MSSLRGSPIPLFKMRQAAKGIIKDIKEIVVRVTGLPSCLNGQIVDLGRGVQGIIMGFDANDVLVLLLGDPGKLRLGGEVLGVDEPFRIPVGAGVIGRMLNAMGEPCDQAGEIAVEELKPVFHDSAPITWREQVTSCLSTGTRVVDSIYPIAKGQRQLIIGDRMTGKTVIAQDAVLNQKGQNVVAIYCCIGKSLSAMEKVVSVLQERKAFEYTCIVMATDNAPVGEQYLVPFSAATVAEYFSSRGRDVLVVFDDLTKHAWAYRQLSLLLDRPPGREAYPGDIFYVQTQLMERAGKFNAEHGGGSITFLGIAETLQGDMTGFIPSNLASMCDGQIAMSAAMFAEGSRPAIDFTASLSIIGSRVQPPILKQLGQHLRADYARYLEVVQLSKMQASVSGEAELLMKRGQAMSAVMQQGQNTPAPLAEQVLYLYALHLKLLEDLSRADKDHFCRGLATYAREKGKALLGRIEEVQKLTPEIEAGLKSLFSDYMQQAKK
jgi:F-type H+-transporting ATPase subunit alpha